jgi:hypothetical protein
MCKSEMIWECAAACFCECGAGLDLRDSHHRFRAALQTPAKEIMSRSWREVVSQYSQLSFTIASDRLPALSGLARQMAAKRPGASYLAGLWSDSLDLDLLWHSTTLDNHPVPSGSCSSPSWSWAEKGSHVAFPKIEHGNNVSKRGIAERWFKVVKVDCIPATADPTGQVEEGRLMVEVAMFDTILHSITKTDCRPETVSTRKRPNGPLFHKFIEFRPDGKLSYPCGGGVKFDCARMALVEEFSASVDTNLVEYVMVLVRDVNMGIYRRVGMLLVDGATYRNGVELVRCDSPFDEGGEYRTVTIM